MDVKTVAGPPLPISRFSLGMNSYRWSGGARQQGGVCEALPDHGHADTHGDVQAMRADHKEAGAQWVQGHAAAGPKLSRRQSHTTAAITYYWGTANHDHADRGDGIGLSNGIGSGGVSRCWDFD